MNEEILKFWKPRDCCFDHNLHCIISVKQFPPSWAWVSCAKLTLPMMTMAVFRCKRRKYESLMIISQCCVQLPIKVVQFCLYSLPQCEPKLYVKQNEATREQYLLVVFQLVCLSLNKIWQYLLAFTVISLGRKSIGRPKNEPKNTNSNCLTSWETKHTTNTGRYVQCNGGVMEDWQSVANLKVAIWCSIGSPLKKSPLILCITAWLIC